MSSNFNRHLGGSPGSVLVKLLFLSLLVGAFMHFVGVTPVTLVERVADALRGIFGSGIEAVRQIGMWVAYGAAVVVPLWLLSRLLGGRR